MPMADPGAYKTRSMFPRQDADGRAFFFARAMSGATGKSAYIVLPFAGTVGAGAVGVGLIATAPFATGAAASVSAFLGAGGSYFYTIAENTVASGSDGWFQYGGPCVSATLATCSATTGTYYMWTVASVTTLAATYAMFQSNAFAIAMTSNTGGLPAGVAAAATFTCHDIYLLGRACYGLG